MLDSFKITKNRHVSLLYGRSRDVNEYLQSFLYTHTHTYYSLIIHQVKNLDIHMLSVRFSGVHVNIFFYEYY